MLSEWIKHPITKGMLRITNDILEGNKKELNETILYGPSLGTQDTHIWSQLRGQILALEQVLQTNFCAQYVAKTTPSPSLGQIQTILTDNWAAGYVQYVGPAPTATPIATNTPTATATNTPTATVRTR